VHLLVNELCAHHRRFNGTEFLKQSENRWSTASVPAGLPSTSLIAGDFNAVSGFMRSDRQTNIYRNGERCRNNHKIIFQNLDWKKIWLAAGICRMNPTNYYSKKKNRRTRLNICTDILQQAEAVSLPYVTLHFALWYVRLLLQPRNVRP